MKKYIKKSIEVILTLIACVSLILLVAERPDGTMCLPWTLGWTATLVICAKILSRMGAFSREESR